MPGGPLVPTAGNMYSGLMRKALQGANNNVIESHAIHTFLGTISHKIAHEVETVAHMLEANHQEGQRQAVPHQQGPGGVPVCSLVCPVIKWHNVMSQPQLPWT